MAKLIAQITHQVEVPIHIGEDNVLRLAQSGIRPAGNGDPSSELAEVWAAIGRGEYLGRLVLTGMLLPPEDEGDA